MATCTIFDEDEVCMKTEKGFRVGLVIESSEYVSSDEEDDDDDIERVKKGSVRVAWHPDGQEELVSEDQVTLVDRALMPGDVVQRMRGNQESQRGYVLQTRVTCHVKLIGRDQVICDIDSNKLKPLQDWDSETGDVYMDSWAGKVDKVSEKVVLRFPDGARCCIDGDVNSLWSFDDLLETRDKDSEFCMSICYPGQFLSGPMSCLKNATWIKSTKSYNADVAKKGEFKEVKVVVESVEPKSISVLWLYRGYGNLDNQELHLDTPPKTITGDNIKRLQMMDCFRSSSTELGDKAYYTVTEQDKILNVTSKNNKSLLNHLLPSLLNRPTEQAMNSRNSAMNTSDTVVNAQNSVPSSQEAQDTAKNGQNSAVTTQNSAVTTQNSAVNSPNSAVDSQTAVNGGVPSVTSQKIAVSGQNVATNDQNAIMDQENETMNNKNLAITDLREPSPVNNGGLVAGQDSCSVEAGVKKPTSEVSSEVQESIGSKPHGQEGDACAAVARQSSEEAGTCSDGTEEETDGEFNTGDENSDDDVAVARQKPASRRKRHTSGSAVATKRLRKRKVKGTSKKSGPLELDPARPGDTVIVEVILTSTAVDVMWQDGQQERAIDSAELCPIHHLDDQEFFPGDFVLPSDTSDESGVYGVVERADHVGRTCVINWMTPPSPLSINTRPCKSIEAQEVSAYDIKDHPDYKFRPGALVMRVAASEGTDELASAGQVYELTQDGELVIEWAGGQRTRTTPQQLYLVNYDLDDSELNSDSESDESSSCASSSSWETEGEEQVDSSDSSHSSRSNSGDEADAPKKLEVTIQLLSLLQKASVSLSVEDAISDTPTSADVSHWLHSIHSSYRVCQNCDRSMSRQHFKEDTLLDLMSAVRTELRAEKTHKVAKQVLSMISANCEKAANATSSSNSTKISSPGCKSEAVPPTVCDGGEATGTETVKTSTETQKKEAAVQVSEETTNSVVYCGKEEKTRIQEMVELCKKACECLRTQIDSARAMLEVKYKKYVEQCGIEAKDEWQVSVAAISDSVATADVTKTEVATVTPDKQEVKEGMRLDLSPVKSVGEGEWGEAATPNTPQTPADVRAKLEYNKNSFEMLDTVPSSHHYASSEFTPADQKNFLITLKKELKLLHSSLPKGIYVKGFEDRMDLFSVMIEGPAWTPYEDGLFFFDVQLATDHPVSPPLVHYISYCSDRLNPNLYESGKVCVSLLGTWSGRGTEVWNRKSTLLQVLISFQGLILVSEPYYNEAGYDKQRGSPQAQENSRMYNEMAIVKMVQSMSGILARSPCVFKDRVVSHMKTHGFRMVKRLRHWLTALPTAAQNTVVTESPTSQDQTTENREENPTELTTNSEHANSPNNSETSQPQSASQHETASEQKGASETSPEKGNSDIAFKTTSTSDRSGPEGTNQRAGASGGPFPLPEFPLAPLSKGFCLSLTRSLQHFETALKSIEVESPMKCQDL